MAIWEEERTGLSGNTVGVLQWGPQLQAMILSGLQAAHALGQDGAPQESSSVSWANDAQTPIAFRDYFLNCRSWGKIMGQIVCWCSSSQLQQSYRRKYRLQPECAQLYVFKQRESSWKNAWGFYKYILNSCLCVFSLLHLQAMLRYFFFSSCICRRKTRHVFLHKNVTLR